MSQAWARVGNSAGFRVSKLLLNFALVIVVLSMANLPWRKTYYCALFSLALTVPVFTSILYKITFFLPLPIFVRLI